MDEVLSMLLTLKARKRLRLNSLLGWDGCCGAAGGGCRTQAHPAAEPLRGLKLVVVVQPWN